MARTWVLLGRVLRVPLLAPGDAPAGGEGEAEAEAHGVAEAEAADAQAEAHWVAELEAADAQAEAHGVAELEAADAQAGGGLDEAAAQHGAADFSIPLAEPPRITVMTAAPTAHPSFREYSDPDKHPYILCVDSDCILLNFGEHPFKDACFDDRPYQSNLIVVRDYNWAGVEQGHPITATAERIPPRDGGQAVVNNVESIGLIYRLDAEDYFIAKLMITKGSERATLIYFYAGLHSKWIQEFADNPLPWLQERDREWIPSGVVSYQKMLWWFDLSWGIISYDPRRETREPVLLFHRLPEGQDLNKAQRVHDRRCIAVSQGGLRYVAITPDADAATVSMWTRVPSDLVHDGTVGWMWEKDFTVSFAEIWEHDSYTATGLPHKVPVLVAVSPSNCEIVYFALEDPKRLFGVNTYSCRVEEFIDESYEYEMLMAGPEAPPSCRYVLPWSLPLEVAQGATERCVDDEVVPGALSVDDPATNEDVNLKGQDRDWVALSSVAVVLGVGDKRAWLIVPGAADLLLDMETPPCPSYLFLPQRIAPDPRCTGYTLVVAVASDCLLVRATQGEGLQHAGYFLADVHTRTLAQLPEAPSLFRADADRSIGLIANPLRVDHYLVAQLVPVDAGAGRHESVVTFCTATRRWSVKKLDSAPEHGRWRAHGVVANDDVLWWVDLALGVLFCDPFLNHPELRFAPLPAGCEKPALDDGMRQSALLQRRMLRASDGKLRFVEVVGLASEDLDKPPAVKIWTLVDPDGPNHWTLDRTALFADIRGHRTFAAAGLPQDKVPSLAVIDPKNAAMVSFFFGTSSFVTIDLRTGGVVAACDQFWVDRSLRLASFQKCYFVHAWEPGLLVRDDSPSEKESRGNLIRFVGRNPLSHLRKGNVVSSTAKATAQQPAAMPEAMYEEVALGNVLAKLNVERRREKVKKLLRERKFLCKQLDKEKNE